MNEYDIADEYEVESTDKFVCIMLRNLRIQKEILENVA